MMMSRVQRMMLTAVTLTVFFVMLWVGLNHDPKHFRSPLIGKPAPAFRAPSVLNPNRIVTQQLWQGHVTVLNVFASWCDTCAVEHVFWMDYPMPKGVQLVALDYMDTPLKAKTFLHERGNPFSTVISDPTGQLAIDLGVYGVPETYLLDASGVVRMKRVGAMTATRWRDQWLPRIRDLLEAS